MDAGIQDILQNVTNKTNSELILFFILVIIALVAFLIPMYAVIAKDRKARREQEGQKQDKYNEREREIIHVISENSNVISGLKTLLDENHSAMTASFARMNERMDQVKQRVNVLGEQLTAFSAKTGAVLDEITRRFDGR